MSRPPGLPKTGGRKKGTPNRRSRIVIEALTNLGCDPIEELVKVLPSLEPEPKARVLLSLMAFVYPKKSPTDYNFTEEVAWGRISEEDKEAPQES